jgi:hypothetical protein
MSAWTIRRAGCLRESLVTVPVKIDGAHGFIHQFASANGPMEACVARSGISRRAERIIGPAAGALLETR